jgi:hypothetical protein
MLGDKLDNYWPLADIVTKLKEDYQIVVSRSQLEEWQDRHKRREGGMGFPEPMVLGKYKLYDINEVREWIILWRRATARLGRGSELNGKRQDG